MSVKSSYSSQKVLPKKKKNEKGAFDDLLLACLVGISRVTVGQARSRGRKISALLSPGTGKYASFLFSLIFH
jgi:hypothetical protein